MAIVCICSLGVIVGNWFGTKSTESSTTRPLVQGDRTRTPLPAKVVMELVRGLFGVIDVAGVAGVVTSLFVNDYF